MKKHKRGGKRTNSGRRKCKGSGRKVEVWLWVKASTAEKLKKASEAAEIRKGMGCIVDELVATLSVHGAEYLDLGIS